MGRSMSIVTAKPTWLHDVLTEAEVEWCFDIYYTEQLSISDDANPPGPYDIAFIAIKHLITCDVKRAKQLVLNMFKFECNWIKISEKNNDMYPRNYAGINNILDVYNECKQTLLPRIRI